MEKRTMTLEDLFNNVDIKIDEIEKKDSAEELLKSALIKKKIISKEDNIKDDVLEKIFDYARKQIIK